MAINLGNIVGNTVGGIASGLDTANIIKGLSAARQSQIDKLGDTVSLNNSKVSAYGDLKNILTNLQNSANFLRNPPGVLGGSSNAFNYRNATLSSTINAASYLSVVAGSGASIGKYNIQIGALAEALQQRSGSFNSTSTSATSPSAGSYFTAGTFQVGSGAAKTISAATKANYAPQLSDYNVVGTASGILTSAGVHNITINGVDGGQASLSGKLTGFNASYDSGTETITFRTTINGVQYVSNAVAANSAIGGDLGITSGTTITFTADAGGANETSFDLTLASDVVINADAQNVTQMVNDLSVGLAGQYIEQSRELQNFGVAAGVLTGLDSSHVKIVSSTFGSSTALGEITGFKVQHSNGSDGAISVTIGNETFRATGLGNPVTGNLILQSTTTGKRIEIDLAAAGISVDISTAESAQSFERALDYAFGTRAYTEISVSAGDSLSDIAYKINSQSAVTGMSASIVKVSEFDYRLSLKSTNVGIDNAYELFDSAGVFANTGLTTTQAAKDAVVKIDGVEITRSSNNITDAIENVTISLLAATPDYGNPSAASADLSIGNDVDSAMAAIQSFLNYYYEFREFLAIQTERNTSTSQLVDTALLGTESVLSTLADQLSSLVTRAVNTGNSSFNGLSSLGISISDLSTTVSDTVDGKTTSRNVSVSNALIFDEEKLRQYLTNNFDSVRGIFEFSFNASSDKITIFSRSNTTTLNNFRLDINTARPAGEQVQVLNADGTPYLENGDPVYMAYSAGRITGRAGTALEGLELIYAGSGSETLSISMSPGIADMVFNLSQTYTKDNGSIDLAVSGVNKATENTNTDITKMEDSLAAFVARLQAQYNALEQALARVNNILNYLTASDNARNKSS
jgi:flagellar hook-associated protein 2